MNHYELAILVIAAVGVLGVAFALAWIDASPRGRRITETTAGESTD